jgi:RNA polymerase sigma-70 factor, ECF subfamily
MIGPDTGRMTMVLEDRVPDSPHFDAFYRSAFRRMVGQMYTVVGDLGDAEDIAQEAFLAASRDWAKISTYERPEAWVRRAGLNRALNLRRRAQRKSRALQRVAAGLRHEAPADSGDHDLVEALRGVPMRYRVVLTLHYLVDLPVAEIAEELEVPVSTVKTRLARGRRRLQQYLVDAEERS